MKGDFSKWRFNPKDNYCGVLHQQGRVLLDADWNDEVLITHDWQTTAGQDIIGPWVAAVPAEYPDGFKVQKAELIDGQVVLTLGDGRAWVHGNLVRMERIGDSHTRVADPLEDPAPTLALSGSRDAVVLELWHEEINSFQMEDFPEPEKHLLEPALGGPDTTERAHKAMAFRLLRLQEGEHCRNIQDKLNNAFDPSGKLTVTLKPEETTDEECPVTEGGGYTGFEHNLYRIEIADVNESVADAMFKWSAYNGGLVGRGDFEVGVDKTTVTITANLAAIASTRMKDFYMEVMSFDQARGHWRVAYGANVVLDANVLTIQDAGIYFNPAELLPSDNVFFRLWNGIARVNDYDTPAGSDDPEMLRDGIRLAFSSTVKTDYRAGDFWVFTVRADVDTAGATLINNQLPQGVVVHRVPLAILHWNDAQSISYEDDQIDDCRRIFKPLINQKVCCTFTIGDGVKSQGDFNSAEEALRHLPTEGGQLCFLPGEHSVNLKLEEVQKIRVTGCGRQSILHPRPETPGDPVIMILDSRQIQIDNLTMINLAGYAIAMEDTEESEQELTDIRITGNYLAAFKGVIGVEGGSQIRIDHNEVAVFDRQDAGVGIFMRAQDSIIEDNRIIVVPPPPAESEDGEESGGDEGGAYDECAEPSEVYEQPNAMAAIGDYVFTYPPLIGAWIEVVSFPVYLATGGIQLGSASERIRIRRNLISGGCGNGITLGDLPKAIDGGHWNPGDITHGTLSEEEKRLYEAGFLGVLYDIVMEQNEIYFMGLSGIGVAGFYNLENDKYMFSVIGCSILENRIQSCALQPPAEATTEKKTEYAFGGVVLMDAEELYIHRNRIEYNGLSHLQPVCGIWVQQSERAEICDNRIVHNGPRREVDEEKIQKGHRGGIVLLNSISQMARDIIGAFQPDGTLPVLHGTPAAKIHDNTVVQPLGHALVLLAMGPVSIVNNHLVSQGVDYTNPLSLIAGAVVVMNLGIAKDVLPYMLVSFRQLAKVQMRTRQQGTSGLDVGLSTGVDLSNLDASQAKGLYEIYREFMYLPSGQILYDDNRITMDLRPGNTDLVISSQALITLDDISYVSNQAEVVSVLDYALVNAFLVGFSVRTTNNRFQEGMTLGIFQYGYSLLSYGVMNTTVNNQSTNCLLPLGTPAWTWTYMNSVVLFQRCQRTLNLLADRLGIKQEAVSDNTLVNLYR